MIVRKTIRHSGRRGAFTLLEILVVVAIIVVLAGVGGMVMLPQLERSKENTALTQVKGALSTAVQTFYLNEGRYPNNLDELCEQTQSGGKALLERDALLDPWKKPYQYDASGQHNRGNKPDIWTVSPSGKQLGNWPQGQ
jgi:general secretion pathway protein G